MDSLWQALSDGNRREILRLLKDRDMSVSEIKEHFDITGASLSHHLDILKRANLVIPERRGQFIFYSLNVSVFEEAMTFLMNFFNKKS